LISIRLDAKPKRRSSAASACAPSCRCILVGRRQTWRV
jgi:hypothetical protein